VSGFSRTYEVGFSMPEPTNYTRADPAAAS